MAPDLFDADDFSRQLKRAAEEAANQGMRQMTRKAQAKLDGVQDAYAGRSPEDIEAALRSTLGDLEWAGDDDGFRAWAEAIAEGRRVVIRPERVRL